MNNISLGRAWSLATSFFSGLAGPHAIILIVVGILIPSVLGWAVVGGSMSGMMNPAALASGEMMAGLGAGFLVVSLVTYVLQYGSYFASWRQGLAGGDESVGGALTYGLIAGAVITGIFIATVLVFALLVGVTQSPWVFVPALLIIIPLFAMLAPAFMGLLSIVMLLLAAFGSFAMSAVLGQMGMGDEVGMGGGAILLILILAFLFVWLGARLSCAAPLMAHRKSYNPIDAMKSSWAMTATSQWKIVGYLMLIGLVLLVLVFLASMILGAGMMGAMQSGDMGGGSIVSVLLFSLLISIPMAYLTVAIPGGIYKELGGDSTAQTFA
ncbi:MAG: hypothetical protein RLZZ58_2119 [Pseudomonadota bacterium]